MRIKPLLCWKHRLISTLFPSKFFKRSKLKNKKKTFEGIIFRSIDDDNDDNKKPPISSKIIKNTAIWNIDTSHQPKRRPHLQWTVIKVLKITYPANQFETNFYSCRLLEQTLNPFSLQQHLILNQLQATMIHKTSHSLSFPITFLNS